MIQAVVPSAGPPVSVNKGGIAVIVGIVGHKGKCMMQSVPSAVQKPRSLSVLAVIALCIAEIVSINNEIDDKRDEGAVLMTALTVDKDDTSHGRYAIDQFLVPA
jgi:hypothetical protein